MYAKYTRIFRTPKETSKIHQNSDFLGNDIIHQILTLTGGNFLCHCEEHSDVAISWEGNRIIKPTQDIFLFAWRKETNKCCVMKLFARFFNDTSYTHHKTIFNQCIIFSREMFFQIVFHHFRGFLLLSKSVPLTV